MALGSQEEEEEGGGGGGREGSPQQASWNLGLGGAFSGFSRLQLLSVKSSSFQSFLASELVDWCLSSLSGCQVVGFHQLLEALSSSRPGAGALGLWQ